MEPRIHSGRSEYLELPDRWRTSFISRSAVVTRVPASCLRELVQGPCALDILFNTQDTNLVCEIQKSHFDNLADGPSAVDARRDELVFGLETLGAHCAEKVFNFSLI